MGASRAPVAGFNQGWGGYPEVASMTFPAEFLEATAIGCREATPTASPSHFLHEFDAVALGCVSAFRAPSTIENIAPVGLPFMTLRAAHVIVRIHVGID